MYLISHCLTVVWVLFCSLKKGITQKIHRLCFVLINSFIFNFLPFMRLDLSGKWWQAWKQWKLLWSEGKIGELVAQSKSTCSHKPRSKYTKGSKEHHLLGQNRARQRSHFHIYVQMCCIKKIWGAEEIWVFSPWWKVSSHSAAPPRPFLSQLTCSVNILLWGIPVSFRMAWRLWEWPSPSRTWLQRKPSFDTKCWRHLAASSTSSAPRMRRRPPCPKSWEW